MSKIKTTPAIAIITNHFDVLPVEPKLIYINNSFLNLLDKQLEDIINKSPTEIFTNWENDKFIQEILQAVENKVNWCGKLSIKRNDSIIQTDFIITPVYDINGEINYYSCRSLEKYPSEINDKQRISLDNFVISLWEYQEHFKETCELAPVNILKINKDGIISYANHQTLTHFGLSKGLNFFDLIQNDVNIKEFFNNHGIIGKISKVEYDLKVDNNEFHIKCNFWPITDLSHKIIGYSLSISDNTKNKQFTKQLLELKGKK